MQLHFYAEEAEDQGAGIMLTLVEINKMVDHVLSEAVKLQDDDEE